MREARAQSRLTENLLGVLFKGCCYYRGVNHYHRALGLVYLQYGTPKILSGYLLKALLRFRIKDSFSEVL